MKHPHFSHVREHLEHVRDGYSLIPNPESIYRGKTEESARLAVRNWVPFVAGTASREGLIPVG
jgi:hypothetical protein